MTKPNIRSNTEHLTNKPSSKITNGWESNINILGVDDDKIYLKVLEYMLSEMRFKYKLVNSGNRCLEEYSFKKYDLIILDLIMPKPNGFECAKFIRKEEANTNQHIKIIGYSTYGDKYEKEAIKAGCDLILTKPVLIEDLHKALSLLLFDN